MLPQSFFANFLIDLIHRGGPVMYPVVATALFAVCIVTERCLWWLKMLRRRTPQKLEEIYAALEGGRTDAAIDEAASGSSRSFMIAARASGSLTE